MKYRSCCTMLFGNGSDESPLLTPSTPGSLGVKVLQHQVGVTYSITPPPQIIHLQIRYKHPEKRALMNTH